MARDSDVEMIGEAETAKTRLCQGIAKSRALVTQYRARLAMLQTVSYSLKPERPLFRFGRGEKA